MVTRLRSFGLLAASLVLAPVGVSAIDLLAVSGDGGAQSETLFFVNRATAALSLRGALGNGTDGEVIIYNPVDARLYHLSGEGDVSDLGDPVAGAVFESLDPRNPADVVPVPFTGLTGENPTFSKEPSAGAFDITTGGFIVADGDGFLYRLSSTGQVAVIGDLGFQVKGLAFRGSTLYAIEQFDSFDVDGDTDLLVLDTSSGRVVSSVNISLAGVSLGGRNSNGLAVDPETGALYAIVRSPAGDRLLVTIDPVTGNAALVGALDERIAAIAFLGLFAIADAFSESLTGAGIAPAAAAGSLVSLALHGAHHRPLLTQRALKGDNCVWVHGDTARTSRDGVTKLKVGEAGICRDVIPGRVRVGLGLGKSSANQELRFGGDVRIGGQYLVGELNYRARNSPIIGTMNLLMGSWKAKVQRNYDTFGIVDGSYGETDVRSWAVRFRVDFMHAFSLASARFTPRAELTLVRTTADAYDEANGLFPVSFDRRDVSARELRIGVDAEMPIGGGTRLLGLLEGAQRFGREAPQVTGTIIGQPFTLRPDDSRSFWARAGVGVEHELDRTAAVLAHINAATRGDDAEFSSGISIRIQF